jgi:hypothetical protein
MASTHTDSIALLKSIEAPADFSGQHDSRRRIPHSASETSSCSRIESNHAIEIMEEGDPPLMDNCGSDRLHDDEDSTIALSSTNKVAGQTVAPFLARHIPDQYAPQGVHTQSNEGTKHSMKKNPNTKYCYRHRPDSKCRRTADEPTMENLQRVREQPIRRSLWLTIYRTSRNLRALISKAYLMSGRSSPPPRQSRGI